MQQPPTPTVPRMAALEAPAAWRTVDFISDLHLHKAEPATFDAWRAYLQATPADAVFILGDLFEVWVGDDVLASPDTFPSPQPLARFEDRCASVLRAAASRRAIFFMHGNRDFLVGPALMARCNATLLSDPTVLIFAGQRWLLSHGDALCLADTDYLQFRQQVRSAGWQDDFLARPLAERQAMALHIRQQSEARKHTGADHADVDSLAARQWLQAADARTLIHGHTHRPAAHDLGGGLSRVVLSDWDAASAPPRAEVLRLAACGLQRIPMLSPAAPTP